MVGADEERALPAVGIVHRPDEHARRRLAPDERLTERSTGDIGPAVPALTCRCRDDDLDRDRGREVHVDATRGRLQREQIVADLLDESRQPPSDHGHLEPVAPMHELAQTIGQRAPVLPVLGRVTRRRFLFGAPLRPHRRARRGEVRVLRQVVGQLNDWKVRRRPRRAAASRR